MSTTGVYISGGNMAAPKIGPLLADILDYMGVEKKYTAAESAAVDVVTPQVTGMTVDAADSALRKKGLSSRTVGEGDTVTAGEPLFEIETDKVVNQIEATEDGILRRQLCEEGDTVDALAPVAIVETK